MAGALAELMAGLPAGAGRHWLQTSGFCVNCSKRNEAGQPHATDFQTTPTAAAEMWFDDGEGRGFIRDRRLAAPLLRFVQNADLADDRVLWLVTIAAVADNPRRAADTNLPARANRWLRTVAKEGSHRPGARGADAQEVHRANPFAGCLSSKGASSESPAAHQSSAACFAAPENPGAELTRVHGTSATPDTPPDGEFTAHGGSHFQAPHRPEGHGADTLEAGRANPSADCRSNKGASSESPAICEKAVAFCAAAENPGAELTRGHGTSAAPDTRPDGEFTGHGGLLFLVPMLERLGLPEFFAARPAWLEAGFGSNLLIAFGARVGLRTEDPMARALRQDESPQSDALGFGAYEKAANLLYSENDGRPTPDPSQEGNRPSPDRRCFPPERGQGWVGPGAAATRLETRFGTITSVGAPASGPASWDPSPSSRRAGGQRSGSWAGSTFDCNSTALHSPHSTPFTPWISAARRWCRRNARLGLHSLIVRPARVQASSTHLDVSFALRLTDLRIRRAGLDLDPGWVPWIGRVVRFHYEDSDGR